MKSKGEDIRPAIWTEGSQSPPFDARAFALTALKIGRESVSGILSRCGASAGEVGHEMKAGRLRLPGERLGRSGRYLPDAQKTGRAILGGASILRRAAELVQPNAYASAPKEIDAAYRDLFREGDRSAREAASLEERAAARLERRQSGMTDDLAAIRAVLNDAREADDTGAPDTASRPARENTAYQSAGPRNCAPETAAAGTSGPGAAGIKASTPLSTRLGQGSREAAARVLGYWMIAFALPYGALRAGLKHLRGEDLRKMGKAED